MIFNQKKQNMKLQEIKYNKCGSSRPEVSCKKGARRNFTKLTGKHLCQSLFINKVAGLRPQNTFFYRAPLMAASENDCDNS